MYAKNMELTAGRVAWGNGLLLHRPVEYDRETNSPHMAQMIDPDSLKVGNFLKYNEVIITQSNN